MHNTDTPGELKIPVWPLASAMLIAMPGVLVSVISTSAVSCRSVSILDPPGLALAAADSRTAPASKSFSVVALETWMAASQNGQQPSEGSIARRSKCKKAIS
jgi:hypothetical protein